jgi:D-alanyl-D-alanine carboxypeptidase
MLTEKYAAYKNANGLPENAGILVYLETPKGNFTASAGLPAGANENWHYRIASVSKTFTAASIMLLDQQGKLKIDDTLTANIPGTSVPYLPDSPNYAIPYKDKITIRQLLSHRAGVFDVFNNQIPSSSTFPYADNNYGLYVTAGLNEPDHQFTADELIGVIAANQL